MRARYLALPIPNGRVRKWCVFGLPIGGGAVASYYGVFAWYRAKRHAARLNRGRL